MSDERTSNPSVERTNLMVSCKDLHKQIGTPFLFEFAGKATFVDLPAVTTLPPITCTGTLWILLPSSHVYQEDTPPLLRYLCKSFPLADNVRIVHSPTFSPTLVQTPVVGFGNEKADLSAFLHDWDDWDAGDGNDTFQRNTLFVGPYRIKGKALRVGL